MSIKLTSTEAKIAGSKKISGPVAKDQSAGTFIDAKEEGFVCYIGPCDPDSGTRVVCYHTDSGCDDCWLEEDEHCTR